MTIEQLRTVADLLHALGDSLDAAGLDVRQEMQALADAVIEQAELTKPNA